MHLLSSNFRSYLRLPKKIRTVIPGQEAEGLGHEVEL